MAGHAGDGVIQNHNHGIGVIIGDINQAGNPGVDERGVSDDRHGFFLAFFPQHLIVAVE